MVASWLPSEASNTVKHLRKMKEEGVGLIWRVDVHGNSACVLECRYFIPEGVARSCFPGMVAFDEDYLRKTFFPTVVKERLEQQEHRAEGGDNLPVMMIHARRIRHRG